jgi:hypothetical protein
LHLAVYQPASRFWLFQGVETAIFAGLTAILVLASVRWLDTASAERCALARSAEHTLKKLEPLVGGWRVTATAPPDGPPWPGEGRTIFEWHESGALEQL